MPTSNGDATTPHPLRAQRRAGVLLHPTSLPSAGPHGCLGREAHNFIEFLAAAGITVWQTLPLGPTHEDLSPYQCWSVHAGNPLLIDLDWLAERGWLAAPPAAAGDNDGRYACLHQAYAAFAQRADDPLRAAYAEFQTAQAHWLDDFALFAALRHDQGHRPWWEWPAPLRDHKAKALGEARARLTRQIEHVRFEQFVFFQQWQELKQHAEQRGLYLFGDLPIFVAHDSAEVWAHRRYFALNAAGQPEVVAGVPPDYFSATGQRWGNPLYRWEAMRKDGFRWWVERIRTQATLFHLVRIDHFRGFQAYWEIPAAAETAIDGHWVEAPGEALLNKLARSVPDLPLVAEDLGVITPDVTALREQFGLPGMKILQFAFDTNPANVYLPHQHEVNCVVYTGTHDNDTSLGWYEDSSAEVRHQVHEYLGRPAEAMPWPLLRSALASVAWLAVLPMQDLLGLGRGHRMNTPGVAEGNWRWRFQWDQVAPDLAERLRYLVHLYQRAP